MPTHMKRVEKKCIGPECMGCSAAKCYSEGGEVDDDMYSPRETLSNDHPEKHQKGVHETARVGKPGESTAGYDHKNGFDTKPEHRRVLSEIKSMKKPNLYAKGGEIKGELHMDEPEMPGSEDGDEDEIHGLLGEELMGALERKDKKAIMQCIEACVMNCMSKDKESME